MDSLKLFLFASLPQLVSQIILSVSWLFPISVATRSSLLNDILWKRKKVHRTFNEISIGLCFFLQEMPACAVDDATFQHDRHAVHCVLGSVSSNSHNSMFPTS